MQPEEPLPSTSYQPPRRSLWDWFWKDHEGRVKLWQTPNIWLIGWAVLTTISLLFTGSVATVFSWAGLILLAIWCLLEIFKGINGFRRLVGLLVAAFVVMSAIRGFNGML